MLYKNFHLLKNLHRLPNLFSYAIKMIFLPYADLCFTLFPTTSSAKPALTSSPVLSSFRRYIPPPANPPFQTPSSVQLQLYLLSLVSQISLVEIPKLRSLCSSDIPYLLQPIILTHYLTNPHSQFNLAEPGPLWAKPTHTLHYSI